MKETEKAEKIAQQATGMVFDFFIDIGLIHKDEIETITVDELTKRMNKMAEEAGYNSPKERGLFWSGLFDQRNKPSNPQ